MSSPPTCCVPPLQSIARTVSCPRRPHRLSIKMMTTHMTPPTAVQRSVMRRSRAESITRETMNSMRRYTSSYGHIDAIVNAHDHAHAMARADERRQRMVTDANARSSVRRMLVFAAARDIATVDTAVAPTSLIDTVVTTPIAMIDTPSTRDDDESAMLELIAMCNRTIGLQHHARPPVIVERYQRAVVRRSVTYVIDDENDDADTIAVPSTPSLMPLSSTNTSPRRDRFTHAIVSQHHLDVRTAMLTCSGTGKVYTF